MHLCDLEYVFVCFSLLSHRRIMNRVYVCDVADDWLTEQVGGQTTGRAVVPGSNRGVPLTGAGWPGATGWLQDLHRRRVLGRVLASGERNPDHSGVCASDHHR